jgi:tripartite-type tricarboxylate transporter receptor subunit TctC
MSRQQIDHSEPVTNDSPGPRRVRHRWRFAVAFALVLAALGASAQAQDFPAAGRSITIIVPYAPGGTTDTSARLMGIGLARELNTSVQVVNREGAASQVGLTELVRAKPDGYTLSYAVLPTVVTHYLDPARRAIYTAKSFQMIATHTITSMVLAVRSDGPYKTLKDLVDAARAAPGDIKVSDSGLLGVPHTNVLLLTLATGAKFTSVHFGGGAPSVTALLGGHVDVLSGATSDALAHKTAGTFRVLGIAADEPDPSMPDVTTMRSQGFDVVAASIAGIVAPAGTPAPVVAKLTAAIERIVADPEHRKRLADLGVNPYYRDPAAFAKIWQDNEGRMGPLLTQFQAH